MQNRTDPYAQTVDEYIEDMAENGGGIPRMLARRILDLKKENEELKQQIEEIQNARVS